MAEWLYEAGIGEARAALVDHGRIVAAQIDLDDGRVRLGAVLLAQLDEIVVRGREGLVTLAGGTPALLSPLPSRLTQGGTTLVEVVREAIREPGRDKLARAAPVDATTPRAGPLLLERITASGVPVHRCLPHQPDALEAAGWSEVLEEAVSGMIAFPGGALRMTPTPAMTLFDVDGSGPLEPLAVAAAQAVSEAIVRHDIGGSIGIDFPTIAGKEARAAVGAALDAVLPKPYERTAVNGFGFLQVIRRRARASLPELLLADSAGAETRALLRRVERTPPPVPGHHRVPRRVYAVLAEHPDWVTELSRRCGTAMAFEKDG